MKNANIPYEIQKCIINSILFYIGVDILNRKHKKAGAYCAGKKRNQYIDTCLYRWRYMHVDIYTRTDTWYEMA